MTSQLAWYLCDGRINSQSIPIQYSVMTPTPAWSVMNEIFHPVVRTVYFWISWGYRRINFAIVIKKSSTSAIITAISCSREYHCCYSRNAHHCTEPTQTCTGQLTENGSWQNCNKYVIIRGRCLSHLGIATGNIEGWIDKHFSWVWPICASQTKFTNIGR